MEFLEWYARHPQLKDSTLTNPTAYGHYKYLMSIDGFGAAWARVPHILFTGSVLFLRADCKQYFYPLLINMTNCVKIYTNLTNLETMIIFLENNEQQAEDIGQRGKQIAETFLSPVAIDEYFMYLFRDLNDAFDVLL